LEFRDYITITQLARTWADAYDQKDPSCLRAILAPTVHIDYGRVSATIPTRIADSESFIAEILSPEHLGRETLLTQHFLGQPYVKSVSAEEIVVEWQQNAGHGRWDEDAANSRGESTARSYIEQRYVKGEGPWKLAGLKPS
ncbi:NTF2-like protein, partial [Aspergillus homomorphus CBS 101889]